MPQPPPPPPRSTGARSRDRCPHIAPIVVIVVAAAAAATEARSTSSTVAPRRSVVARRHPPAAIRTPTPFLGRFSDGDDTSVLSLPPDHRRESSKHVSAFGSRTASSSSSASAVGRGGGGSGGGWRGRGPEPLPKSPSSSSEAVTESERDYSASLRTNVRTAGVALFGAIVLALWEHRTAVRAAFDRERFKTWLLGALQDVNEKGGYRGLAAYVACFMLWECMGLPTVPVETVAGMAFGLKRGFVANAVGKSSGSLLAYTLGRAFLEDRVRLTIEGNDVLALVEKSVERHPLGVSLVMRYSVFPQVIKNLFLAIMPPVTPWIFTVAILTHGLPFTALWTYLGWDSAERLRASSPMEPNFVLRGLLVFVTLFGFFGSPALVGLWVQDMRKEYRLEEEEKRAAAQNKRGSRWRKNFGPINSNKP